MRVLRTRILTTILLASIALGWAACTPPVQLPLPPAAIESTPGAPTPAPTKKVRLLISPFLSYAPFYLSLEEGFFADEGLEVEIVHLEHSSDAIPALAQGDIDLVGTVAGASTFSAIARGAALKIVADRTYWAADGCDYTGLVIRPDLLAGQELVDPDHLAGRHVATNPVGAEGFYVEKILQDYGLTLDDMVVDDVPTAALSDALSNGSLDLVNASEPWVTRIVESGAGVLWKGAREATPDFQFGVVMYGPSLLEKDRETGERIMRAYLRGVRQYNEGKTERNIDIIARATELEPDLVRDMCWPSMRSDGVINADSLMEFQQWLVEKGYLDDAVPVDALWDASFVEKAVQSTQP